MCIFVYLFDGLSFYFLCCLLQGFLWLLYVAKTFEICSLCCLTCKGSHCNLIQFFSNDVVRKVRMALDMPSGCSFSPLRLPMVKLESLQYRMSNLQSTLSSGWESLRKVRVMPRLPANSSFSRHSLAYMHASAQYIKQVSGLLKTGVTSLRSSSSSYEVMQGSYFNFMLIGEVLAILN